MRTPVQPSNPHQDLICVSAQSSQWITQCSSMDVERGKKGKKRSGRGFVAASFVHRRESNRHNPQAMNKKIRVDWAQSPESAKTPHLSLKQVSKGWILLTALMVESRAMIEFERQQGRRQPSTRLMTGSKTGKSALILKTREVPHGKIRLVESSRWPIHESYDRTCKRNR